MNKPTQGFIIKVVGIVSIIYAIPSIRLIVEAVAIKNSGIVDNKSEQAELFIYSLISAFSPIIILSILGIILTTYGDKIAIFLTQKSPDEKIEETLNIKTIQPVAFSVIGVLLIGLSIPEIAQVIMQYMFIAKAGDPFPFQGISFSTKAHLIGVIIKLILGILLFFGSNGLTSLWYFFQKSRPLSKINTNT